MRALTMAALLVAMIGLGGCAGWYAAGDMGGSVGGRDGHRNQAAEAGRGG